MNHLISVRSNTIHAKNGDDITRFHEIIMLVDKPKYRQTNDGEIIRERSIKDQRYVVSDETLDQLIESLQEIRNTED